MSYQSRTGESALTIVSCCVVVTATILACAQTAHAQSRARTLYVDNVTDPLEDGTSLHPFDAIQEAVDEANHGDTVIVRNGTYLGAGNTNIDPGGLKVTIRCANGPLNCKIDCANAARGFHIHSGETRETVIDGFWIIRGWTLASGGAISIEDSSPTITKCLVSDGTADLYGGSVYCKKSSPLFAHCDFWTSYATIGGGVAVMDESNPTFETCTFRINSADSGGGLFLDTTSDALLKACEFHMNSSTLAAGGVLNAAFRPVFEDCVFTSNTATKGAGIYNEESSATFTNCRFEDNSASNQGGGMYNAQWTDATLTDCMFKANAAAFDGAGMYNDESSPTLTKCRFEYNSQAANGGGIYNGNLSFLDLNKCVFKGNVTADKGGGICCDHSEVNLDTCYFERNRSGFGGGIYSVYSHCTANKDIFIDNVARHGGGIGAIYGSWDVRYGYFTGNTAEYDGGGVLLASTEESEIKNCQFSGNKASSGKGGGVYLSSCSPDIWFNTFSKNWADDAGGGMYNQGARPHVLGNIFRGNDAGGRSTEQNQIGGDAPDIHYCSVEGWTGAWDGIGNIGDDPLFRDPLGPDGVAGTEDDDLRLTPFSPCIDAVDGTLVPPDLPVDLDENERMIGENADMGAYEYENFPVPTVSQWGLTVLALSLLIIAKVRFGHRAIAVA